MDRMEMTSNTFHFPDEPLLNCQWIRDHKYKKCHFSKLICGFVFFSTCSVVSVSCISSCLCQMVRCALFGAQACGVKGLVTEEVLRAESEQDCDEREHCLTAAHNRRNIWPARIACVTTTRKHATKETSIRRRECKWAVVKELVGESWFTASACKHWCVVLRRSMQSPLPPTPLPLLAYCNKQCSLQVIARSEQLRRSWRESWFTRLNQNYHSLLVPSIRFAFPARARGWEKPMGPELIVAPIRVGTGTLVLLGYSFRNLSREDSTFCPFLGWSL